MRIGLLSPYSLTVPGGVQNQVMALARSLRARGHEARVLAPNDGPPLTTFVTPLGASVRQPSNGSVAPIAPDPAAQFRTIRALWDEDFDVLHLHEPFVPGPTLTALFLKPAPLVGTFHAAGSQPAYRVLEPIARWAGRRLDAMVAVSEDARALAEPHTGGEWTDLFNGVELGPLRDAEPWPTSAPTVLFLGRHEPRKGLPVLLDALGRTDRAVTVWVAGEGDDTDELRRRHPDPRIEWLGRIDDAERNRRLAGADVLCAPSLGGESFGIILLEAMAAGTSVVASAIGGYEKVATAPAPDGSVPARPAAELVPPGDPVALAAALDGLLADPAVRAELVEIGARRAEAFDIERLCERYLSIYESVVGSTGSRRAARTVD